jgi:hypothetical protein
MISPLFTATPVHGVLQDRLKATRRVLFRAFPGCEHATLENSQGVAFGRAELVGMYLAKSQAPMFLSLDADIGVSADVVARMIDTYGDVVIAPYRQRVPPHEWTFRCHPQSPVIRGTISVLCSALGCALIRRHVFEALRDDASRYVSHQGYEAWDMFRPSIVGDSDGVPRLEEADYSFCHRVRALGYSIVGLVGAEVDHDGTTSTLEPS